MKIIALIHHPKGGCEYYRQIIPLESIKDKVDIKGINNLEEMPDADLIQYDILHIIRKDIFVSHELKDKIEIGMRLSQDELNLLAETKTIDRCKKLGLKIVFDIDDYWMLDQTHMLYHRYKRINMIENTLNCIRKADIVTTTQQYLADKIKPYNSNVHLIPNCITPTHKQWQSEKEYTSDKVRIGWVGGIHHLEDVKLLRECFQKLWNDPEINDKIQFVLGGHVENSDVHKYFIHIFSGNQHPKAVDNMMLIPAMDVFSFGQMYELIDIVIAPLVDTEFNRCKSNLKIVEAGWKGKCVIASDVFPYACTIRNNESGVLINNRKAHKDWYKVIKSLILNEDKRKSLSNELQKDIFTNFNAENYKEHLISLYESVIKQPVN